MARLRVNVHVSMAIMRHMAVPWARRRNIGVMNDLIQMTKNTFSLTTTTTEIGTAAEAEADKTSRK